MPVPMQRNNLAFLFNRLTEPTEVLCKYMQAFQGNCENATCFWRQSLYLYYRRTLQWKTFLCDDRGSFTPHQCSTPCWGKETFLRALHHDNNRVAAGIVDDAIAHLPKWADFAFNNLSLRNCTIYPVNPPFYGMGERNTKEGKRGYRVVNRRMIEESSSTDTQSFNLNWPEAPTGQRQQKSALIGCTFRQKSASVENRNCLFIWEI